MTTKNPKPNRAIASALLLTGGAFYLLVNLDDTNEKDLAVAKAEISEIASEDQETGMAEERKKSTPLSAPRLNPGAPQDADNITAQEEEGDDLAAIGPKCSSDKDCRGPRTADCIETLCEAGICVINQDACECVSSEECDDGDECTRDLCFSSTKKCIHIQQECE